MTITYRRTLGLFSGTMAVVGGIIGSGIFNNPAIVAARVHTSVLTLGAWVLGAAGALPYAGGWNDGSRLAAVEAIADHHTLAIDDSVFAINASGVAVRCSQPPVGPPRPGVGRGGC